jgi:SNF2 family DNA or RNA helicase
MEAIEIQQTTDHLQWHQISKAMDGCYETQKEVADAIFKIFEPSITDPKNVTVFDPTAGGGRLLKPFKKAGCNVFGIEFKESLAQNLKRNIGKANARQASLLDLYTHIKYNFKAGIVVANPPFGLTWDISGFNSYDFDADRDEIESQHGTLEILTRCLTDDGYLALIIPTSTWTNQKDKEMINYLYSKYKVLSIITIDKAFKKEYGLDLTTDLVIAKKKRSGGRWYGESDPRKIIINIKDIKQLPELFSINTEDIPTRNKEYVKAEIANIPNLTSLTEYTDISNEIVITTKGYSGSTILTSLLNFYDATQLNNYNSVLGKPTSIEECYFTMPSLIHKGVRPTIDFCEEVGIPVSINERTIDKFKSLKEQWNFKSTPLYKPKAHELLAYFEYKHYKALKDLKSEDGKTTYIKGKQYLIKPTWERNVTLVEKEEILNAKGNPTGEIKETSLDSGYMVLEVTSEDGIKKYRENTKEEVEEFTELFRLPDVKGIAELYPDRVKNWANVLAKNHQVLFDWQAEDLARILCKRNVYIGYEMGGGKTLTSMVYATARGYSRVLIICQGSLVAMWMNEAKKFGFNATAIKSHSDIARLKQRIKDKDFIRHTTEFFIVGMEFLSLDGGKLFNEWECIRYDNDGGVIHSEICIKGKCSKGHKYESQTKQCPNEDCNASYDEGWTGRYCNKCGYTAYSYGIKDGKKGMHQYPAYKHLTKLFSCVITDESQNFAKRSLRGEASRAFKAKSKLFLTGTIMKNYIEDVFLNFGWLLGYQNPIYYYRRGDTRRFLDEFGSYKIISKRYLKEMKNASYKNRKNGSKQLLPEVSNLNRFWKLISPFTVRRLTEDVKELREIKRERHIHYLDMFNGHFGMYLQYEEWAKRIIERELRKEDREINLGIISNALWKLRFAATCPNSSALVFDDPPAGYPNIRLETSVWNKIDWIDKYAKEHVREKKDKIIVFSGLRWMQSHVARHLQKQGYKVKYIGAHVKTDKRVKEILDFENNFEILVTGNNVLNRGYTINAANHVIFMDQEYTPEITDQGECRCIRPGQEKEVSLHYLLSAQSIDEQMHEVCNLKREAINAAINKKTKYTDITELLKQADYRNPEMKVARDIHNKVTVKFKAPVRDEVVESITTIDNDDIFDLANINKDPEIVKVNIEVNKSDQWFINF